MSSWDRFNPQLRLKNTLAEINVASQPDCVRRFVQSGVSIPAEPARQPAWKISPGQETTVSHIECSEITTGDSGDLHCCWSLKEVLLHVGWNLAPPFQAGLHLVRKTQHNAQLLDPDAYPTLSLLCIRMRHRSFLAPFSHTLVEEHKALENEKVQIVGALAPQGWLQEDLEYTSI